MQASRAIISCLTINLWSALTSQRFAKIARVTQIRSLYVMDFAVLEAVCKAQGQTLEKTAYDAVVQNINAQDLKAGSTTAQLKDLCAFTGNKDEFKKALAPFIRQCPSVYSELKQCIFPASTVVSVAP